MAAPASSYKLQHEDFVSGHNGTTTLEIATVVTNAPLAVLLRNLTTVWVLRSSVHSSPILKFCIDFLTLVTPVLLSFTVLADNADAMLIAILVAAICLASVCQYLSTVVDPKNTFSWEAVLNTAVVGKRSFITNFRAYVNIATAVSILAVDFSIFPRRFCKAETYGTGLMDVGVGAFVISNAIVSPEARGKYTSKRSILDKVKSVVTAIKSCIPLIILGLVRLVTVKGADYQEHVSEYGVHWNFFFTLVVVKVLSCVVLCLFSPGLSWFIAVVLGYGYQYLLLEHNMRDLVLHGTDGQGSREGLLNANREGIFSAFGYLAIYFAGVQLGKYVFQARVRLKEWVYALLTLVILDIMCWILLDYVESNIEPVSRRMANLGFIVWMMAYNLQLLASFLLVDIVCIVLQETGCFSFLSAKGSSTSRSHQPVFCLLEATNRNGLAYFLLANLLTGMVNMSMKTIYADNVTAMAVLFGYMVVLSVIMASLHLKDISLKIW